MDKKRNLLGVILAVTVGVLVFAAMIVRAFWPQIIIPRLNLPAMVLISVIALLIDHYFAGTSVRNCVFIPIFSALIFGLFPYAACFMVPLAALRSAILGAVVFTAVTYLFDSIIKRISIGPATKLAPLIGGFGIYLSSLGLMGIV